MSKAKIICGTISSLITATLLVVAIAHAGGVCQPIPDAHELTFDAAAFGTVFSGIITAFIWGYN